MFVDSLDQQEFSDAKLAHIHPEAYEDKMKESAYNPISDLIILFKRWIAKQSGSE